MPEAISDSSTLIHLAGIGRLEILKEFYDHIVLSPAVWKEVVEEGRNRQGSLEVKEARNSGQVRVIAPANESLVHLLEQDLHKGEAETIALSIERHPEVVFLDEFEARKAADIYNLRRTGTIGILIRARLEGKIASLREELDRLRNEGGFWIGDDVYRRALQAVEEKQKKIWRIKNMRRSIIFCLENHRERRVHREKWQPSAFSVYSAVDYLIKHSNFHKKIKNIENIEPESDFKEELRETIRWSNNGSIQKNKR